MTFHPLSAQAEDSKPEPYDAHDVYSSSKPEKPLNVPKKCQTSIPAWFLDTFWILVKQVLDTFSGFRA